MLARPYRLELCRGSRSPPRVVPQPLGDHVLAPGRRLEGGEREVVVDAAVHHEHLAVRRQTEVSRCVQANKFTTP